jgi:hypothetical protein
MVHIALEARDQDSHDVDWEIRRSQVRYNDILGAGSLDTGEQFSDILLEGFRSARYAYRGLGRCSRFALEGFH